MCFMTDRNGGTHGYIRGHLRLRVHDPDLDYFVWSVWVELAKDANRRQTSSSVDKIAQVLAEANIG